MPSWVIGERFAHNAVRTVQSRRGILRGHTYHLSHAFALAIIDIYEGLLRFCELKFYCGKFWWPSVKMTAVKKALAMRQLDSMFGTMTLEGEGRHSPLVSSTVEHDPHCDVHGRFSTPYRSSLYLHSRESTPYRECISPTNGLIIRSVCHNRNDKCVMKNALYNDKYDSRRRGSLGLSGSPAREMEHPSSFPSILRRDRQSPCQTPPRRDTPSPTQKYGSKRHSMGSFPNLSRGNVVNYNRRDSVSSTGIRDMKRDYVGSMSSLSRKSSIDTKKSSTDSLENWHINWDSDRHNSISSLAHDDRLSYGHNKVTVLNSNSLFYVSS